MRLTQLIRRSAAALAMVGLAGCANDGVSGPEATPVAEAPASLTTTTPAGLLARPVALASTLSSSATIGPLGGTISLSKVGLKVIVPAGALLTSTRITVSTYNKALGYDFQPHGTKFLVPLVIVQSVPADFTPPSLLNVVYVADRTQVDESTMTANANEFLPLALDTGLGQITFSVSHFSGYMLSTGRK